MLYYAELHVRRKALRLIFEPPSGANLLNLSRHTLFRFTQLSAEDGFATPRFTRNFENQNGTETQSRVYSRSIRDVSGDWR